MQLKLPMLTYYEGPRLVSQEELATLKTYRDAVRACWALRARRSLTHRQLAVEAALYASHVSDYLALAIDKRELPAKHVAAFELACGNHAISQWLMKQTRLTILEQFIELKAA